MSAGAISLMNYSNAMRPHYGRGYTGRSIGEIIRPKLSDPPEKVETLCGNWWIHIIVSFYLSLYVFGGLFIITLGLFAIVSGISNMDSTRVVFQVNDAYFQFNQDHPQYTGDDVMFGMDVYVGLKLVSTPAEYSDKTGLECKIPLYSVSTGVVGKTCRGGNNLTKRLMEIGSCTMTLGKMTCANYSPGLGAKYLQLYQKYCEWFPGEFEGKTLNSPQVFLRTYGPPRGTFIGNDNNLYREVFIDWSPGQLCNSLRQSQPTLFEFIPPLEYFLPILWAFSFLITLIISLISDSKSNGMKEGRNQMRAETRRDLPLLSSSSPSHTSLNTISASQSPSVVGTSSFRPQASIQVTAPPRNHRSSTLEVLTQNNVRPIGRLDQLSQVLDDFERRLDLRLNCIHVEEGDRETSTPSPPTERAIPNTENTECPITMEAIRGEYSQCGQCHKNVSRTAVDRWRSLGHLECPLCRGSLTKLVHYKTPENRHVGVNVVEEPTSPFPDLPPPPPPPPISSSAARSRQIAFASGSTTTTISIPPQPISSNEPEPLINVTKANSYEVRQEIIRYIVDHIIGDQILGHRELPRNTLCSLSQTMLDPFSCYYTCPSCKSNCDARSFVKHHMMTHSCPGCGVHTTNERYPDPANFFTNRS